MKKGLQLLIIGLGISVASVIGHENYKSQYTSKPVSKHCEWWCFCDCESSNGGWVMEDYDLEKCCRECEEMCRSTYDKMEDCRVEQVCYEED